VTTSDKNGKTTAKIEIPTSLDKTKTAIIAAAIETIERIGPSNGKITLDKIEDVRTEKRDYIQERAKQILSRFLKESSDGEVLTKEVSDSVKTANVVSYGPDKLPAGPDAESNDKLILVEGRADVIALLKAGINNCVSVNGTSIPDSIAELMKTKKTNIAFVDGDRGGDLIVKALEQVGKVDFIAKAPDGKEVEELVGKEILKALRSKRPTKKGKTTSKPRSSRERNTARRGSASLNSSQKKFAESVLDEIEGKGVVRVYNSSLKLLGELPASDLKSVRGLSNAFLVVADAPVTNDLFFFAMDNGAQVLVGTKVTTSKRSSKLKVFTKRTL
jgi:DNA primase